MGVGVNVSEHKCDLHKLLGITWWSWVWCLRGTFSSVSLVLIYFLVSVFASLRSYSFFSCMSWYFSLYILSPSLSLFLQSLPVSLCLYLSLSLFKRLYVLLISFLLSLSVSSRLSLCFSFSFLCLPVSVFSLSLSLSTYICLSRSLSPLVCISLPLPPFFVFPLPSPQPTRLFLPPPAEVNLMTSLKGLSLKLSLWQWWVHRIRSEPSRVSPDYRPDTMMTVSNI